MSRMIRMTAWYPWVIWNIHIWKTWKPGRQQPFWMAQGGHRSIVSSFAKWSSIIWILGLITSEPNPTEPRILMVDMKRTEPQRGLWMFLLWGLLLSFLYQPQWSIQFQAHVIGIIGWEMHPMIPFQDHLTRSGPVRNLLNFLKSPGIRGQTTSLVDGWWWVCIPRKSPEWLLLLIVWQR